MRILSNKYHAKIKLLTEAIRLVLDDPIFTNISYKKDGKKLLLASKYDICRTNK